MLALAGPTVISAQVRQPMPAPTLKNPQQPAGKPNQQPMPIPGTPGMPVLTSPLRIVPLKMYNMLKRPFIATTAEGRIVYFYRNERDLIGERIVGPNTDVIGKYTYARDGRFERIDYSDDITITATYGNDNELVKLTSSTGRSIGFAYNRSQSGTIRSVTPTQNALEFHSAIALLRQKQAPDWWRRPEPAGEFLKDDEGENGKTTAPDSPWHGTPEYPHDPFPGAPRAPDGTPIIVVEGSPQPPDSDPGLSPLPTPPVQDGGIDINPDGSGGRGGGNVDPGVIKDLDDYVTFKEKQQKCHQRCFNYRQEVDQFCKTGPNYRAFDQCLKKSGRFYSRCINACDRSDWDHDFQHKMTPEERDFFPWLGRTMEAL